MAKRKFRSARRKIRKFQGTEAKDKTTDASINLTAHNTDLPLRATPQLGYR